MMRLRTGVSKGLEVLIRAVVRSVRPAWSQSVNPYPYQLRRGGA